MNEGQKIQILREVIRIKSVNDNEVAVANYFRQLFSEHGIEAKLVKYNDTRSNLIAEIKGQKPGKVLVFSGHMDVVAAGDEAGWTYDPFGAEIVDGKMYGRGTTDMKAGLTALVIAMIELQAAGCPFKGTIRLVATVGEEIGMLGSKQLTEAGYVDDADGLIIAEPSSGQIIIAHKGSLQYEVISHGKAAHSSMPQYGINAIQQIVDYIQAANPKFEAAAGQFENAILGRMVNANTVINGGDQINSIPEKVVLQANARTIPQVGNEVVLDIINSTIAELNSQIEGSLELHVMQNNPSIERAVDSDLVQAIKQVVGDDVPTAGISGATDASNFGRVAKQFDFAMFGPGTTALAHTVDEYVEVDDYLNFINIYIEAAKNYLA